MNGILFTILIAVPPSLCVVDCRTACIQCQENDQEQPEILEVYCAMCHECIDHRRERKLRENIERQQIIYNLEEPDECPPPPPCDPEPDNNTTPEKLLSPTTITTTIATSTTKITTRRPCPTAPPCQKRKPLSPCYPCMPMCPCPYPQLYTSPGPQPLAETSTAASSTTTKTTGYLYVYIGVPKDIIEKALPISRTLQ